MTLNIVTLMPSDLLDTDHESGCVGRALKSLNTASLRITLLEVQPIYRRKRPSRGSDSATKRIRFFSMPAGLWRPFSGAFLFARVIGQFRQLQATKHVDLIHAHGLLPCGHAAMLLSKELGIPYIVSIHGLDDLSTDQRGVRRQKWSNRIARRVCKDSLRAVCPSEHHRERLLEMTGGSCRTSVVYNGIDPEAFSPTPEPSEPACTVLSGGLLTARAGHDILIRATAHLVQEFPSISLEIIGDGEERSRLQTLVEELNLAKVVNFLSRESCAEVATRMKRCTLFALPGQSEGISCMYLEAMSCAKAVIGCRGQGIAEIIQHGANGFLVGPGNEKELTLAIGMLFRKPQLRQNLGGAARDTILDRFTVQQQAQNLARIYRESVA